MRARERETAVVLRHRPRSTSCDNAEQSDLNVMSLREQSCPNVPPAPAPPSSPISKGSWHKHHRDLMASMVERSPALQELPAPILRSIAITTAGKNEFAPAESFRRIIRRSFPHEC